MKRICETDPRGPRGGFTLLEIAVVIAIAALILGGAMTLMFQTEVSFANQMRQVTLDKTGRQAMDRISFELRQGHPDTVLPLGLSNSSFVEFRRVVGFEDDELVFGPTRRLSFELAPGETANGYDDNGDRRPDEGFLVYEEEGVGEFRIGSNLLDLRFDAIANGISFSVEVGVVDRDGTLLTRTFTQQISFRN